MGRTIVTEKDIHEKTNDDLRRIAKNIDEFLSSVQYMRAPHEERPSIIFETAALDLQTSALLERLMESVPVLKRDRQRTEQLQRELPALLEKSLNRAYRQAEETLERKWGRMTANYQEALRRELEAKYQETLRELEEKHKLEKQADNLSPDNYMDRLLKYIPAESVALYLTLQGIILSGADASRSTAWLWAIFGIGVICTPLYLWRIIKVSKVAQLAASTAAFIVWVFALGGAFESLSWYEPFIGSLVLVVFTFLVPLLPDEWVDTYQE